MRPILSIILACTLFWGCSPYRFFYYPNDKLYANPDHFKMNYEMHEFKSLNGKKLFGLLFQTELEPKGIVVHFHGNYGNVSNHFLASHFLVDYGFDVFIFDYQGYGSSEGKPNPKKTIEDGIASVRFAAQKDRSGNGVFVLGQSLGGAIAIVTTAKEPLVKAAVIEASFPRYRAMARDVIKRSALLWILYPIYPFFLGKKYDPDRYVGEISPRPLLFIHGTGDNVVPLKFSKKLFEKAKEPKELWIVPDASHMGVRPQEGELYERRIANFFSAPPSIPLPVRGGARGGIKPQTPVLPQP